MSSCFISISFKNYKKAHKFISSARAACEVHKLNPIVFVEDYDFSHGDETKMMEKALEDVKSSSVLIAEGSTKAIGVGIEVGIAAATKIPILYARQKEAEYSKTISGLSTVSIEYDDETDLKRLISEALTNIKNSKQYI